MADYPNTVHRDDFSDFFWKFMQRRAPGLFNRGFTFAIESGKSPDAAMQAIGMDAFNVLFQMEPRLVDEVPPGMENVRKIFEHTLDSADVDAMRLNTRYDEALTAVAWPAFFNTILRYLEENAPPPVEEQPGGSEPDPQPGDAQNESARWTNGKDDEAPSSGDEQGEQPANGDDPAERRKLEAAVAQAVDDAEDDIKRFKAAWGQNEEQFRTLPLEDRLNLVEQVAKSKKLGDILELAGRFERISLDKKEQKMMNVPIEVIDIETGNDLANLLPQETMLLADEEMEDLFFQRFIERSSLQYKLAGPETLGKGPIIICCDVSGSMRKRFERPSKAATVAVARIAHAQRRAVRVVLFSMQAEVYDCPADADDGAKMRFYVDLCTRFSGGGTDFNKPLNYAAETIEAAEDYSDADILFITDGEANVDAATRKRIKKAKADRGFNLYTIFIQAGRCKTLEKISDRVWSVNLLNEEIITDVLAEVA